MLSVQALGPKVMRLPCAQAICIMSKVIDVFMCIGQGCSIDFVDRLAPVYTNSDVWLQRQFTK